MNSRLVLNMGRYSNGSDREFWLQSWNGGVFVSNGRAAPLWFSITCSSALQAACNRQVGEVLRGDQDGMYARLLIGWPEEPRYQPLSDDAPTRSSRSS
jgi:hypothetical protein